MGKRNKIIIWTVIVLGLFIAGGINSMFNPRPSTVTVQPVSISTPTGNVGLNAPEAPVTPFPSLPSVTPELRMPTPPVASHSIWDGYPEGLQEEVDNMGANEDCDGLDALAYSGQYSSSVESYIYDTMDEAGCSY